MSVFDAPMDRRTFARSTAALSAGLAAGVPIAAVLAQDATPAATPAAAPGLPPIPEGAVLVAQGLWNPRFIAISDDGTLYVTENGIGGDEVIAVPPQIGTGELAGATPVAAEEEVAQEPPPTRGATGQITSVAADGTQTVVASGLASYSIGAGPVGIALGVGEVYFSIGGGAVELGIEPLAGENAVHRLVLETGAVEQIAYIAQYEIDNNPDGTDVNSNLYQIAIADGGTLLVADAGGNTLYTVDPAASTFDLAAVVPALGGLPGGDAAPAEQAGRQSVPTGVVVAGGTTFVGLLSEFWPEGVPSVLTLAADGTFGAVAGPLFFCVGLTVGPDQQIYASQLFGPPAEGSEDLGPGSVVRVYGDGTIEPVLEGVMMPHGIDFDVAGNMYVAINSLMSGPGFAAGQVIRVDGVAAV